MYKIFSKNGCPFCERSIKAFKTFELEYTEYKLGLEFTREDFLEKFGKYSHKTFPAIYKDEVFVGGFDELKKVLF